HYGTVPVTVEDAPDPLDVAAAWTDDRRALTVGVVNPTLEMRELRLDVAGCALGAGRRWVLTGPDAMAHNEPGKDPLVTVREEAVTDAELLRLPPLSACLYEFAAR
ncbi:MAG TPA: alpha-N-arabinofuranosidase, partial [Candidatus Hydrogenedentes bacterium]|nr:alpha-N-arabinofuranosidase [Candidatus Hydrogenedentota bacterium]